MAFGVHVFVVGSYYFRVTCHSVKFHTGARTNYNIVFVMPGMVNGPCIPPKSVSLNNAWFPLGRAFDVSQLPDTPEVMM